MSRYVRVTPEAESDIAEALDWYESTQPGLGQRFLDAVAEAARLIGDNPEVVAPVHADMRRVLLRVFPYALFYLIEDDALTILGCFHGHRDPRTWKNRFRKYREA